MPNPIRFYITIILAAIILALTLALTSCASPVADPSPLPAVRAVTIKNSLWQDVQIETVARFVGRTLSRVVSDSELLSTVEEYNASTLDDFLRVYYDEAPSLEESPTVDVFICHPVTHAVNMAQYGIPRTLLVENEAGWRADAYGQTLYIDHVPPPPVIVPPASLYAHYSLYVVDAAGDIKFEDHCGYTPDEVWHGAEILAGGWVDADDYFDDTRRAYASEVMTHPGWRMIERQLYVEVIK